MNSELFNFLKDKILDKRVVILGEVHGTKETPQLFSDFISEYSLIKDFTICLEIPSNEQENITKFARTGDPRFLNLPSMDSADGRNSFEMRKLIKNISALKKEIYCIDIDYESQLDKIQDRDRIMAENIQKRLGEKQLIVFLGNFHASRREIKMNNVLFETTGSLLNKKLKDSLLTINLMPLSGEFFNTIIKKIEESDAEEFYDYTFNIDKVTPCRLN